MKKIILFVLFISTSHVLMAQAGPCNATIIGTNTTVISSNTVMGNAGAQSSQGNLLVCAGNTLTFNSMLAKGFYVQGGATLILKSAQIARIYLESGATLQFDTTGAVFNFTIMNGITYDSTNVTFIDTNQIHLDTAAIYWNHCLGNTFNYTSFTPTQPCNPLSVDNSLKSVLDVTFTNPVYDRIKFHSLVNAQVSKANIIDLSGKLLKEVDTFEESIDVSNFSSGIYLIQFTDKNGGQLSKKFLKN